MVHIGLKWLILLLLNSIAGIYFGLYFVQSYGTEWIIGMALGIMVCWLVLCGIELKLKQDGHKDLIKHFTIAALVKMVLQCFIIYELLAGVMVMQVIQNLGLLEHNLLAAFMATLGVAFFEGFLLAIIFILTNALFQFRMCSA